MSTRENLPVDAELSFEESGIEILSEKLALEESGAVTLALVGNAATPSLVAWNDETGTATGTRARLAHAVAGLPAPVRLDLADGTPLFGPTGFAQASAYLALDRSGADLALVVSFNGQDNVVGTFPGVTFPENAHATLVLVGFVQPPSTADVELVVLDDVTGAEHARIAGQAP